MTGGAGIKRSGTRSERIVKQNFESFGWKVVRSGASLGSADLICFKNGGVLLVQVKRRTGTERYKSDTAEIEHFPVYVVVDFGRGDFRIDKSGAIITKETRTLRDYLLNS